MPQVKRPKRGSHAFYPRKRASRIYPALDTYPESDKPKAMAFAGYKAGMTHAIVFDGKKGSLTFGQEVQVPATILECPPVRVIGIRAYSETAKGLKVMTEAVASDLPKELARKIKVGKFKTDEKLAQIEKSVEKISHLRFVVSTDPSKTAFAKKTPEVFEIEVGGKSGKEKFDFAKGLLGKEIKAEDVIQAGEAVDVIAVTTGKGTEGPVRRFGIRIQDRHAKQKQRHVGAIAQQVPRRVRFTALLAGQVGFQRRTELNKRILKIGDGKEVVPSSGITRYGILKSNYVLVQGSVPGPKKRLVLLRTAIRPPKARVEVSEVREIVK